MKNGEVRVVMSILMIALLFFGVFATVTLDSDFGGIEVKTVSIWGNDIELSGLLYRPKSATASNPRAGIVIAHGIGGSKEMMSGIGLELARRGFVSFCLDLFGHGKSQGAIQDGQSEPSFGVYSAIQYLKAQRFVDSSALGLIGHSLGAGAVRAAAFQDPEIEALILIAGGLGDQAGGQRYGVLNATYPRNLLVIVGKYDILFNLSELATKELPLVFGSQQEVASGLLYGDFASGTARKFVTPLTSHLFEPIDPVAISASIEWMEQAIGNNAYNSNSSGFIYVQREASIAVALVGLLGIALLLSFPITELWAKSEKVPAKNEETSAHKSKLYVTWAIVNLALFVPMFAVGLAISFPPLIFGSSVAWWMLVSGLVGTLLLVRFANRIFGNKIDLKLELVDPVTKRDIFAAAVVFLVLLAVTTISAIAFNFTFRIVSPILRDFSSARRLLVFPAFVPFFFVYFVVEGLYLHKLIHGLPDKRGKLNDLGDWVVTILGKIFPFVILLFVQYGVQVAFGIWLLPSFAGFLLEFLWLIVPIFAIASTFSWWFFKQSGKVLSGALLNTLLMAWIASVVFPF